MNTNKNHSPQVEAATRRFVSEQVIAEVTGRGIRTLQKDRLLGNGPFPHYQVGRQIRYDPNECISIIEKTRKAAGEA